MTGCLPGNLPDIAAALTPEWIVRQVLDVELGLRLAGVVRHAVHAPAAHVDDPGIDDLRPTAVPAPLTTAIGLSDCGHILETGNDGYRYKASSEAAKKKRKATPTLTTT